MDIREKDLVFSFPAQYSAVKFDDTRFYRDIFAKHSGAKGVDIIADSNTCIQLIEVKDCTGHEVENRWKTFINNSKRAAAAQHFDVVGRDSYDIEISKKVASTIVCLYGAWAKSTQSKIAMELLKFWNGLYDKKVQNTGKSILVILFLEGNFENPHSRTRSKKMIMKALQDSLNTTLSWLICRVSVVDSTTYKGRYFKIRKENSEE